MRVIGFLVLTFGYSWGVIAYAHERGLFRNGVGAAELPYLVIFMAGPAIAGVILSLVTRREMPIAQRLGLRFRPNWWWLVAWALPVTLCFGAVVLTGLAGFAMRDPEAAGRAMVESARQLGAQRLPPLSGASLYYATALGAAIVGALINMVGTLTEELGWRGYLWSKLRGAGFWRSNLAIGAIWGLWHAPVIYFGFNYPGAGWNGVAMMTLFCTLLAPMVGLVREVGRSVLAASLFHGTLNAVAGVSLLLLAAPPVLWNGVLGWAGMGLMLAIDLLILMIYRPSSPNS